MGKLFRNSRSHKYSFIGKRRIKDGECAAIWDSRGDYKTIVGPAFIRVFMSDVAFLDRFVAAQNEYLVVKFKSGHIEHYRGPHSMFKDPVIHESVKVEKALELNDSEAIVIYTKAEDDIQKANAEKKPLSPSVSRNHIQIDEPNVVKRRIVRGPTLFTPAANEWLHEFKWHGRLPDNKARYKAGELQFTKLRLLPSTLYYNVSECRTKDDAELEVKLMLFYHNENVETMLNMTHDPIGEILNGLCADIINFCSQRTFLNFVGETHSLNELDNYKVLIARAKNVGFCIDKVVFRGYKASSQLQAMHDKAVSQRTKLRLESEAQEQELSLTEMRLSKSMERAAQEQEMAKNQQKHELDMAEALHRQKMEHKKAEHAQEVEFLSHLATKGVDLTRYLVSKNQQTESVKVVRIENMDDKSTNASGDNSSTGGGAAHIHFGMA